MARAADNGKFLGQLASTSFDEVSWAIKCPLSLVAIFPRDFNVSSKF